MIGASHVCMLGVRALLDGFEPQWTMARTRDEHDKQPDRMLAHLVATALILAAAMIVGDFYRGIGPGAWLVLIAAGAVVSWFVVSSVVSGKRFYTVSAYLATIGILMFVGSHRLGVARNPSPRLAWWSSALLELGAALILGAILDAIYEATVKPRQGDL